MTTDRFLSAALIAAAAIATPAMAREAHVNSGHHASATTSPTRAMLTDVATSRLQLWTHLPRSPGITVRVALIEEYRPRRQSQFIVVKLSDE
jgi:hypothetical protein